jgi:hypothetical protein
VYYADAKGVKVIGITDLSDPSLVYSYNDEGFIKKVISETVDIGGDVYHTFVYLSDTVKGLRILNVTDRRNPKLIGTYQNDLGIIEDMVIEGNYLYLAKGADGLKIIDISDRTNPTEAGSYQVADTGAYAWALSKLGPNYLFVAYNASGLILFNCTDRNSPDILSSALDYYANATTMVALMDSDTVYAGIQGKNIVILNFAWPYSTLTIANYYQPTNVGYLNGFYNDRFSGPISTTLYISNGIRGLDVATMSSDRNEITHVTTFTGTFQSCIEMVIMYPVAYIAGLNSIVILNITNPTQINQIRDNPEFSMYYDEWCFGIAIGHEYIYAAAWANGFRIYDSGYDSDQDYVSNIEERDILGTWQFMPDSDLDGILDGVEGEFGLDPMDMDCDNDGLKDGEEVIIDLEEEDYYYYSDPLDPDSDDDSLNDAQEKTLGTNPLLKDTDGDTYNDNVEVAAGTDPLDPKSHPGSSNSDNDDAQTDDNSSVDGAPIMLVGLGCLIGISLFLRKSKQNLK